MVTFSPKNSSQAFPNFKSVIALPESRPNFNQSYKTGRSVSQILGKDWSSCYTENRRHLIPYMHIMGLLWLAKFDDFQVLIFLPRLKFGRDKTFSQFSKELKKFCQPSVHWSFCGEKNELKKKNTNTNTPLIVTAPWVFVQWRHYQTGHQWPRQLNLPAPHWRTYFPLHPNCNKKH